MANLSLKQERINRLHIAHQLRPHYRSYDPDCQECVRQRNWRPPSSECGWCTARLPNDATEAWIAHNKYHIRHPESITK